MGARERGGWCTGTCDRRSSPAGRPRPSSSPLSGRSGDEKEPERKQERETASAYLGVKSSAAAAAGGVEVDDDEPVAGGEERVGKLLGRLDLDHVRRAVLLPPLHRSRDACRVSSLRLHREGISS